MNRIASLAALALAAAVASAQPLSTAFTFQGRLDSAGAPASGTFDLRFTLFDALTGGGQVGPQLCSDNLAVVGGEFTVQLDFGSQFSGQQRFLEIWVRPDTGLPCSNATGFTILGPRQSLTAAPNSVYSLSAANAVQLNNQPASFYTNAANLASGTLPDARLSSNAALLAGPQTFSGSKTFSAPAAFTAANGTAPFSVTSSTKVPNLNADQLDGLDSTAFSLTSHTHDASVLVSGVLADARLSTNIPRLNGVNIFAGANSFSSPVGIGTSSPSSLLELRTADAQLRVRNSNDTGGAMILDTFGSLQLGMYNPTGAPWNSVPANGYRAVLAMDTTGRVGSTTNTSAAPVFRNVLDDGSGRMGIGAASPNAPLDLRVAAGQALEFRYDSGVVPGINVNTTSNPGILRLRNAMEVWPSDDASRAGYLDVRNTAGATTISLDGATGNLAAHNLPALKGAQTFNDSRGAPRGSLSVGNFAVLDTVSTTAPANGSFLIFATVTVDIDATAVLNGKCSMELKLDDNTVGQSGQITNTRFTCRSGAFDGSTLSIVWTRPVSAGVAYTYQTSTYLYKEFGSGDPSGSYWSSTLHVVFIPNSLP